MGKQVRLITVLLVVAMVAIIAAGCSSNQAVQQQKTAEKKPQSIVIAYTPWTGYSALFIAKEKGMFKNRGVEVELQSIEGVGDRKQALVAGKIQAMAASLDVSVSAAGEGVPMKFVWAFDASNGADGLIVKKDITSVADLKGKEVAYHKGSASHFFLSTILEKAGMTDKDIKAVDMKASEAASAFMAGKIDAAVTWEPHLSKAVAAGDKVLSSTKDTPGLIADVLAFREEYVVSNPETVQAVVEALAEATEFLNKNPEESSKILAVAFKMKPEEVLADIQTIKFYDLKGNLEFYGSKDKPGAIYDVGKRAGAFYVNLKLLSQAPDLSKFVDDTFINKVKK
jgi:NitT/TauT family transport system substrate-binding protein